VLAIAGATAATVPCTPRKSQEATIHLLGHGNERAGKEHQKCSLKRAVRGQSASILRENEQAWTEYFTTVQR
jgi:hypothetical protein